MVISNISGLTFPRKTLIKSTIAHFWKSGSTKVLETKDFYYE